MELHPRGKRLAAALFTIAIVGALGFTAYRYVSSRNTELCPACAREIHLHSRTVATDGSARILYCCPACALRQRSQSGKPLEIVELTNQLDGSPLKPASATVVVASDVNPCVPPSPTVGQDSQPMQVSFDRCEPSILAFASREDAERFARQHGGRVATFQALSTQFR
jgi:hypothetical protein